MFSWRKGGGSDPKKAEATCQRCLKTGHFTYECKAKDPHYLPRRSKKRKGFMNSDEVPDEFRSKSELAVIEQEREKKEERASAAAEAAQKQQEPTARKPKAGPSSSSATSSSFTSSASYSSPGSSSCTSSDATSSSSEADSD